MTSATLCNRGSYHSWAIWMVRVFGYEQGYSRAIELTCDMIDLCGDRVLADHNSEVLVLSLVILCKWYLCVRWSWRQFKLIVISSYQVQFVLVELHQYSSLLLLRSWKTSTRSAKVLFKNSMCRCMNLLCKTLMQCLVLHIIVCALVMGFSVDLAM